METSERMKKKKYSVNMKRLKKGPVAVINCPEEIPCNPCETVCPSGAIRVGEPITNIPVLDEERCTGCGRCIPVCPGLAISVLNYNYNDENATLTVPYELFPLPEKGTEITAVDIKGRAVTKATVIKVVPPEKNNRTALVTFSFPKKYYKKVCYFKNEKDEKKKNR